MGKRILLADDSITIQKVIELTFSDEDFEVVTVGNGRQAIEKVEQVRPDVVLCDIVMPERDGYEVCEFIKTQPSLAHIPVLLLTGAFEPFDQERAKRVGCNGSLAKPFEPQTLIAKVQELLAQAARRPAVSSPAAAPPAPVAAAPPPPPVAAPAADEIVADFDEFEVISEGPETIAPTASGFDAFDPPPEPPALAEPEPPGPGTAIFEVEPDVADPSPFEAFDVPDAPPPPAPAPASPPPPPAAAPADLDYDDRTVAFSAEEVFGAVSQASAGQAWSPLEGDTEQASMLPPPPSVEGFEEAFDEPMPPPEPMPTAAAPDTVNFTPQDVPPPPVFEAQPAPAETEEVSFEVESTFERSAAETMPADAVFQEPPAPEEEYPLPVDALGAPSSGQTYPAVSQEPPAAPEAAASFADVASPSPEAAPDASEAAQVAVPVEMVEKIARRVVGEFSEKVVREIAWEVIPDLAEALIKKEIARLKAELQQLS